MISQLAVSAGAVAVYAWQDGIHECDDGNRYTSGRAQPSPFHRRWCGWPKAPLKVVSLACLVVLGACMPTWQGTVALMALPGVWFASTHPTTVDAPAMLFAWLGAQLMPTHPVLGVVLSLLGGFVHERAPVFCALYAWSPWPLLGLAASGWWRRALPSDDTHNGHGLLGAVRAHKVYTDWLDMRTHWLHLRGVWGALAFYDCPLRVWATVAVAVGSRAVGTDGGRFLLWAAPAVIAAVPGDVPLWALAIHVATFRRCI